MNIEQLADRVIRSENGGCDPHSDPVLRLRVCIIDRVIRVFVVGKWRPIRGYAGKGIPSSKVMAEVERIVKVNTGWIKSPEVSTKKVEWLWE